MDTPRELNYLLILIIFFASFTTLANAKTKEQAFKDANKVKASITKQEDIDMEDMLKKTDVYVPFMYLLNRIIALEKK